MATAELEPGEQLLALSAEDITAWEAYGQACHDPLATVELRRKVFDRALATVDRLLEHERECRQMATG